MREVSVSAICRRFCKRNWIRSNAFARPGIQAFPIASGHGHVPARLAAIVRLWLASSHDRIC